MLVTRNPEHREQIFLIVVRDQEHSHRIAQEESNRLTRLNDAEIEIARRNSHLASVRVYGTFIMVFVALLATVWLGGEGKGVAAIGSSLAAEVYGLKTLFANIEDNPNNVTRFFVIGRTGAGGPGAAKRTGDDKTSIIFTTAHKSGALVDVLDVFRRYGINLTNIDTRPSQKRNFEYYFFVDLVGHADDDNVKKALDEVRGHCLQLAMLGSFPRALEVL